MSHLVIGCGYLGQQVADLWRQQQRRVYATTRSAQRAEKLAALGLEPVVCDILAPASLQALPAASTVVQCVGFDRTAGPSMSAVYVEGLRQVLAALPKTVRRFLYVSSTGVYGQNQGEEVDETSVTEPVEEAGRIMLEAETLLRSSGVPAILLRFAGIYGADRLLRREAVLRGEPLVGDAEKWLNLIHVADGASAVLAAEERGRLGEVYNVCDDQPVRRREFYTHLAALLGAPAPQFVAPAAGAPLPPHERTNRRICNRRLRTELGVELRYPSMVQGLAASMYR